MDINVKREINIALNINFFSKLELTIICCCVKRTPNRPTKRAHSTKHREWVKQRHSSCGCCGRQRVHMTWIPFKAIHLYIKARRRVVLQFSKFWYIFLYEENTCVE